MADSGRPVLDLPDPLIVSNDFVYRQQVTRRPQSGALAVVSGRTASSVQPTGGGPKFLVPTRPNFLASLQHAALVVDCAAFDSAVRRVMLPSADHPAQEQRDDAGGAPPAASRGAELRPPGTAVAAVKPLPVAHKRGLQIVCEDATAVRLPQAGGTHTTGTAAVPAASECPSEGVSGESRTPSSQLPDALIALTRRMRAAISLVASNEAVPKDVVSTLSESCSALMRHVTTHLVEDARRRADEDESRRRGWLQAARSEVGLDGDSCAPTAPSPAVAIETPAASSPATAATGPSSTSRALRGAASARRHSSSRVACEMPAQTAPPQAPENALAPLVLCSAACSLQGLMEQTSADRAYVFLADDDASCRAASTLQAAAPTVAASCTRSPVSLVSTLRLGGPVATLPIRLSAGSDDSPVGLCFRTGVAINVAELGSRTSQQEGGVAVDAPPATGAPNFDDQRARAGPSSAGPSAMRQAIRAIDQRTGYLTRSLLCFPIVVERRTKPTNRDAPAPRDEASATLHDSSSPPRRRSSLPTSETYAASASCQATTENVTVGVVVLANKLRPSVHSSFSPYDELACHYYCRLLARVLQIAGPDACFTGAVALEEAAKLHAKMLLTYEVARRIERPRTVTAAGAAAITLTEAKQLQAQQRAQELVIDADNRTVMGAGNTSEKASADLWSRLLERASAQAPSTLIHRVGDFRDCDAVASERFTASAPTSTIGEQSPVAVAVRPVAGPVAVERDVKEIAAFLERIEASWREARDRGVWLERSMQQIKEENDQLKGQLSRLTRLCCDTGVLAEGAKEHTPLQSGLAVVHGQDQLDDAEFAAALQQRADTIEQDFQRSHQERLQLLQARIHASVAPLDAIANFRDLRHLASIIGKAAPPERMVREVLPVAERQLEGRTAAAGSTRGGVVRSSVASDAARRERQLREQRNLAIRKGLTEFMRRQRREQVELVERQRNDLEAYYAEILGDDDEFRRAVVEALGHDHRPQGAAPSPAVAAHSAPRSSGDTGMSAAARQQSLQRLAERFC